MRLLLDGHHLTLEDVRVAATSPGHGGYGLADSARDRMSESRRTMANLIDAGLPLYGVTTGFGDSSHRQISPRDTAELQRNLLRFLRVGVGPIAPDPVLRATMLIRANCLARGDSAIRPEPVELMLNLLGFDILPMIPIQGSVGASGDLAPLSYLAAALTGEGSVRSAGIAIPAQVALAERNLSPVTLLAKEGLALVNGTSFMSAFAVLAACEARELLWAAELCTALATEIRASSTAQFAPFPHQRKPHPGQIATSARIHALLAGSRLADRHVSEAHGVPAQGIHELARGVQDPYSIRCAPQVLGVLDDTLAWATDWLTVEINSSNDNPLFDTNTATVHYSGNFYGGHVAAAAQALSSAVASVADLLDRQLQLMVDEKFNLGLPANLAPNAGMHHGFKGAQIAASALTAEALHLTMPAGSFSRSTESHNQDKVSMGTIAARHTSTVLGLATTVTAIHLLALLQASDLVDASKLAPATRAVYGHVREQVPFLRQDRPLDGDIAWATEEIRTGRMRAALAGAVVMPSRPG
ncbi:histidine ammonia-lyase [Amycolatopsis sp. cg5]|uniref:HAL/PAL/TAL family ammonia-lyase n=1 Tax=Amycolatopsis sp. cg5 TaxID=3238802 RepID=UPI003524BBB6